MSRYAIAKSLANSLNTVTSMEDVDVDINIGDDAVAEAELDTEIAENLVEATEMEKDIGNMENDIETVENDVETLESLLSHLSQVNRKGGMDSISYEMFQINMDSILRKYGISSKNTIPSLESFSANPSHELKVSMEKVGETLSGIKAAASKVLTGMWKGIKNFLKKIRDMGRAIKQRVSGFTSKLPIIKQWKQRKGRLKVEKELLTFLANVGDSSNFASDLSKVIQKCLDDNTLMLEESIKLAMESIKTMAEAASQNDGDLNDTQEKIENVDALMTEALNGNIKTNSGRVSKFFKKVSSFMKRGGESQNSPKPEVVTVEVPTEASTKAVIVAVEKQTVKEEQADATVEKAIDDLVENKTDKLIENVNGDEKTVSLWKRAIRKIISFFKMVRAAVSRIKTRCITFLKNLFTTAEKEVAKDTTQDGDITDAEVVS